MLRLVKGVLNGNIFGDGDENLGLIFRSLWLCIWK